MTNLGKIITNDVRGRLLREETHGGEDFLEKLNNALAENQIL
jgi:hypothetical protein